MSDDLEKYLNEKIEKELIPNIMEFIKIENQSSAFDPDYKTNGKNEAVCKVAVDYATKLGIEGLDIKMLKEGDRTPVVLGIVEKENAPTILLYGHLDKQPPLTDQWTDGLKPYVPEIRDGKLYGRGGADDGYAFFTCALIIKALQEFKMLNARIVLYFETDEESGSHDLVHYLEQQKARVKIPDLVVCLDSGCCDYDHFCMTTTLRGVLNFTLKVEVTSAGVHSGAASGIIPDTFRIGRRMIEQFEVSESGQLLAEELYVNIPEDKYKQASDLINVLGGKIDWKFPFLEGVKPTTEDGFKQYMNRIWLPQLTLIGMDGAPNISSAGNVLRPFTTFGLSLRLPPTLDKDKAALLVKNFFEKQIAHPYNAKVTVDIKGSGQGFNSPALNPTLKANIEQACKDHYKKDTLYYGEGGSIPFINELGAFYPKSQFIVTGVLGPESNAHGPNEFLHLGYLKKLVHTLAQIVKNYKL
jgi:acetylornithine deacetylase/succinyl-diaminopimelate desuccinylase-like protein